MVVTTAYRIERPCTVLGKHPRERSPACLQEWLCVCILGDSHSRNECCTLVGLEHVLPKRMRPLKLDEAMCRHIMQLDSDVGYSRNQDLLVRCGFEPAEPTSVAATEPIPVATTPTEPTLVAAEPAPVAVGSTPVAATEAVVLSAARPPRATLTLVDACERLGVELDDSLPTLKRKFSALAKARHPDKGGSVGEFAVVKSAYDLLRHQLSYPLPVQLADPDAADPNSSPLMLTRVREETRHSPLHESHDADGLDADVSCESHHVDGLDVTMLGQDAQDALGAADTPRDLTPTTRVSHEKHMAPLPFGYDSFVCDEAFCGICGDMAEENCVGCDNESCMQWFHLTCLGEQKPDVDLPQATLDEMIWWCPNCAPL